MNEYKIISKNKRKDIEEEIELCSECGRQKYKNEYCECDLESYTDECYN